MTDLFYNSHNYVANGNPGTGDSFGVIKIGDNDLPYPVVFTSFDLQKSEKVQVMESFNEFVHINAFGKSADILNITGHIFSDISLNNKMEGINRLLVDQYDKMRAYRSAQQGKLIKVTGPSNVVFSGIIVNFRLSINAQYNNMFDFSFSLIGADSAMAYTDAVQPVKNGTITIKQKHNPKGLK